MNTRSGTCFPCPWVRFTPTPLLTTWVVMVVTLPLFAWIGASYHSARVNKRQTFIEGVINYFADLAYGSLGKQGEPYVPFFIALAIFIFLLNEFGAFPFKEPLHFAVRRLADRRSEHDGRACDHGVRAHSDQRHPQTRLGLLQASRATVSGRCCH